MFKSQQKLVSEIHNEFDTAQERLLMKAKEIIRNTDTPSSKAERLEKIGFVNSEIVTTRKKNEALLVRTLAQAELIEYHKQTYPFQKFLTERELDRICEKYKLVYAPIKNYIKDVPEKNLYEIEKTQPLKVLDIKGNTKKLFVDSWWFSVSNEAKNYLKNGIEVPLNTLEADISLEQYIKKLLIADGINIGGNYIYHSATIHFTDYSGLFIAAPASHFNLKNLTKKGKFAFLDIQLTKVKDPIVFRYCRGGIQVISKWGLEGKDENLVNEKMN